MLPGTCLEEFSFGTLRQPGDPGLLSCAPPVAWQGSKHHLGMGPRKLVVFSCPPQKGGSGEVPGTLRRGAPQGPVDSRPHTADNAEPSVGEVSPGPQLSQGVS